MILSKDITAEMKDDFIGLILDGLKPDQAAEQLGSTGTQFRRHRSPGSVFYDEAFAQRYADAIISDEHSTAFLERLRSKVAKLALDEGNVRLLEKLSLIYDPAWAGLRNPNLNVNVNVLLQQAAPSLSRPELERLREALLEGQKRQEIESGDVIEHAA